MVHSWYEMDMTDQLKLVRDRRQAVEAEIEHLIARIAALKAELPDLQVTERTLARLAGVESPPSLSSMFTDPPEGEPEAKVITPAKLAAALNGGGKPSGLPTMPDMILTLLMEARRRGADGLEPRDLTRGIARRWWPGVKSEEVSPIVWRMYKRGQLRKEGSLYVLPKNSEAADLLQEDSAASG
jgi:hypothetical protein